MAEFILSIIGLEGQRIAGDQVGKMVGKQICESIRSSFKTDMIEKYKELAAAATKSILENPEEMKKLTDVLITTFEGMSIADFKLTSKDSNITGMVAKAKAIGEILRKGGAGNEADSKEGDSKEESMEQEEEKDTNKEPDNKLASALPEVPSINLDNPIDALPGAKLIKSAIQGLKPDEGVVPGYLAKALDEKLIKDKMIEGFGNFITELTGKNSNDLKKVFLDVLKEQINEKFREGGEFQKTIIDIIQKKCNEKFYPDSGDNTDPKLVQNVEPPENTQVEGKPNPTDILNKLNQINSKPNNEKTKTKEVIPDANQKEEVIQPATPAGTTGGKSNKPPKRFTRKQQKH